MYAKHGEALGQVLRDERSKKTLSNAWELVRYYLMIFCVCHQQPRIRCKKTSWHETTAPDLREARGMGKAVDAWHRVSWNIDKPSAAKEPYDQELLQDATAF